LLVGQTGQTSVKDREIRQKLNRTAQTAATSKGPTARSSSIKGQWIP
jgi:hypothetical protein